MADANPRRSLAQRLGLNLQLLNLGDMGRGVAPGFAGEFADRPPAQEAPDLLEGDVPVEEGRSVNPEDARSSQRFTMGSGAAEFAGEGEGEPPSPMRARFAEGIRTELTPSQRDLMIRLLMDGSRTTRRLAEDIATEKIIPRTTRSKRKRDK